MLSVQQADIRDYKVLNHKLMRLKLVLLYFSLFFFSEKTITEKENLTLYPDCVELDMYSSVEDLYQQTCDPYDKQRPFYSKSSSSEYLNTFEKVRFNVSIWAINKDDGTSENPITKKKAKEAIKVLNDKFESFNISFKLKQYKAINDSTYYWTSLSKFSSLPRNAPMYVDTTSINIYLPYRFTNFKNNLRGAQVSSRSIAINSFEYNTGILVHEIGHIFDLKHTHRAFKGKNCERVTRDENSQDYNAHCAGDFVTDTGAMRELNNNTRYISQDCNYMGGLKDCDGNAYELGDKEIKNFMSYTLQHCRELFTTGQAIRAREYIENDPLGIVKSFKH
jgi:hypothetical protein